MSIHVMFLLYYYCCSNIFMLLSVEMQNEIDAKRRKDGKKKDKQTSKKEGQAFLDGDALCTRVE